MATPMQDETNEKRVERSMARTLWKRRQMIASYAFVASKTLARWTFFGPPLDTWSLQLMLLTTLAQEGSKPHNAKRGSIKSLRALMAFSERMPPPKHLLFATASIPVKRRELVEPLKEVEAAEDGSRTIPAEWIVHDAVEDDLTDQVVLALHGGAYYSMSVATHRPLHLSMSMALRCRIFSVDYRLAPESPYPGPLHDAVSAYLYLLDLGVAADNIIVSGDSAGGGLSMALLLYVREQGLPRPGGALLLSPWVDLTTQCHSWEENKPYDYLSVPLEGSPTNPRKAYLGTRSAITNYYASPLFAPSFADLPPILIHVGAMECLRDESLLLASLIGPQAQLCMFDHQPHVFQFFIGTPPARASIASMAEFVSRLPPSTSASTPAYPTLERKVPRSEEPKRTSVAPPQWIFEPADPPRRPPRPRAIDGASPELKRIIESYVEVEPERYTFFAPRRLRGPMTTIEGAELLARL